MKIFLRELSDQETELDFNQNEGWVTQAVERVDEFLDEKKAQVSAGKPRKEDERKVHAHFSLRKVDEVVVCDGQVDTFIQLVCSRCAAEFKMEAHPQFSALFCKDPVMAGVAHQEAGGKVGGHTAGFARHAHNSADDAAVEAGQDLDITYLSQDFIDLADVLTEQLQLQVPFQPLCKESCKGMCLKCGADLNVGRCACAKISKETPFSVLRDFKA